MLTRSLYRLDTTDCMVLVEFIIDLRTIQPIQTQLSFVLSHCCFIRESGCSRVMSRYLTTAVPSLYIVVYIQGYGKETYQQNGL